MTEKTAICEAFSRAAETYDAAAQAQALVAGHLAERIVAQGLPEAPQVLEIGCGTGLFSRELLSRIYGGRWLLTDLSPLMIERAKARSRDERVHFHVMDGEAPDLEPASFDLICSSLAMQWFDDLGAALTRLVPLLKPGGRLMFSTLGPDNFPEWRDAHRAVHAEPGGRPHPSAEDFPWPAGGQASIEEERLTLVYPDGASFVRSLKEIGAHRPIPGHQPLPPGRFRRVLRSLGAPCPVTYHLLYGSYQRPR